MAYFAYIDENNIVQHVSAVDNIELLDANGQESEQVGIEFLRKLHGPDGTWVQTSYTASIRKKFAGIGDTWDSGRNAFIPPMPEEGNWTLNEETCLWEEVI